jgi:hypothetical protein
MCPAHSEFEDINVVLLPGITFFGKALKPVAKNLRQVLAYEFKSSGSTFVVLDDLAYHSGVISRGLAHVSERFDNLVNVFLKDLTAGEADAYRSAGRFEQVLSEFVDGYQLAKKTHASPETDQPRALIIGVYRHHIREMCDWIEELVAVVENPRLAMEKRGIPLSENVEVSVELRLTTPPEMAALQALAEQLNESNELKIESHVELGNQIAQQICPRVGVLESIGALAFGMGITHAVLGGRHNARG